MLDRFDSNDTNAETDEKLNDLCSLVNDTQIRSSVSGTANSSTDLVQINGLCQYILNYDLNKTAILTASSFASDFYGLHASKVK